MLKKRNSPDIGTISISYHFLVGALVGLIAFIAILRILDHQLGLGIKLSEYIQICSFGGVTVGLLYNSISLQYNYEVNKLKFEKKEQALKLEKMRFTYEVTSDWFKADMAMNAERARRFIIPYKGQLQRPEILEAFKKKLEEKDGVEARKSLVAILNYFENLALLLADGIVDEDILRRCFKTAFRTYYINLKEFIEDIQRGNDGGNAGIFANFVALCKKWNEN